MDVRLGCFGLAAVAAVYLGFLGVSVAHAEAFIKRGGYYVLLLTFGLWVYFLWRLWLEPVTADARWSRREKISVGLGILLLTGVAVAQETFRSKILNDEFVLQSTAFNMHFFRDVATMVRGYDILGTFLSTDNPLDKRPNFFPFLISLVHDFTGYRSTNAFYLNTGLLAVTLWLAYHIGRGLAGWRGGALAVGLLGTLPLFTQNATGSGMELLNLTMLLAAVALAGAYLAKPDETHLSALVLAAVLLTECRYESALYVLPVALIVLAGWWQTRQITLSWAAVIIPLLLVPAALHNKVLSNSPALWEMKANQTSRFSAEYVADNVRGAAEFLFANVSQQANSLLLSILGGAALVWALVWFLVRRPSPVRMQPGQLAWLGIGLGIVTNTVLVMFYYWASFADPMAARFCLPFYLLLVFAAVMFVRWLDRRLPATVVLLFVMGLFFLGSSIPKQAQHRYSHLGIDEIEWEKRFVAARPPGPRLVISNKSALPWLLERTPSIVLDRARLVADRLHHQLELGSFTEIFVLQTSRPTSVDGDYQILAEDKLPVGFELELLAEKRFGTKLARISRLVSVTLPPAPAAVATTPAATTR